MSLHLLPSIEMIETKFFQIHREDRQRILTWWRSLLLRLLRFDNSRNPKRLNL
uniref:Uncharacterized protein n=1 Tax=Brassica oleracea var. oleracea TaxID=109376 RepID=A0A0D3DA36_BRAOL